MMGLLGKGGLRGLFGGSGGGRKKFDDGKKGGGFLGMGGFGDDLRSGLMNYGIAQNFISGDYGVALAMQQRLQQQARHRRPPQMGAMPGVAQKQGGFEPPTLKDGPPMMKDQYGPPIPGKDLVAPGTLGPPGDDPLEELFKRAIERRRRGRGY